VCVFVCVQQVLKQVRVPDVALVLFAGPGTKRGGHGATKCDANVWENREMCVCVCACVCVCLCVCLCVLCLCVCVCATSNARGEV
jgi:hypothetical protein